MFGACRVRDGPRCGRAAIWVAIVATVGLVLGACGGAEEEAVAPAAEETVFTQEDLEAILVEHPPVAPGMNVQYQRTLGVLGVFSSAVARRAADRDFGVVDAHEALSVDPQAWRRWVVCTGVLFEDEQLAAEGFDLFLAALRAGGGIGPGYVLPPSPEWTKLRPEQRHEKAAERMAGEMVLVAPATELGDGVVVTGDMWNQESTAYLWRVGNIVLLAASPWGLGYEARQDALHMTGEL